MAWFSRFTRFLDVHLVYAQEAENSCGIACSMMTVFKLNKLTPGQQSLHKEKEIYNIYGTAAGSTYDGSAYTYTNHLATTLNKLKIGQWKSVQVGASNVPYMVTKSLGVVKPGPHLTYEQGKAPIIVLVGWKQGGAHFVVIDSVVESDGKRYATICDPWDGNVHVTRMIMNHPLKYVGREVPWSWDLGGSRHNYDVPSGGAGDGWVVCRA